MTATTILLSPWLRRLTFFILAGIIILILRTPTYPYHFRPAAPKPPHPQDDSPPQEVIHEVSNKQPRSRLPSDVQKYLDWDPPKDTAHYPPYDAYHDRDYDPNRWEEFPQNNDVFLKASTGKLHYYQSTDMPYDPFPNYFSTDWSSQRYGEYVHCQGPRGKLLNESDAIKKEYTGYYRGKPDGFPDPDVGSWEALGLDTKACFDRKSRLGPYGYEEPEEPSEEQVDWARVRWGRLQERCLERNAARYEDPTTPNTRPGMGKADLKRKRTISDKPNDPRDDKYYKFYHTRTAVLIRAFSDYNYEENDLQAIRSLVSELSLQSGGEYQVFLLVHIKDMDFPIFESDHAYTAALNSVVPEEFRDMAILFSEKVHQQWYPKIGEWSVYWQQFMPLQWFSRTHPQFDFIWNWEMDARYIGHHYHFVESISKFARNQPRKYLWERNSRFYIPGVHGTYSNFTDHSNFIVESGKKQSATVWGPQPWTDSQQVLGPTPPTSEENDKFKWGVGEEADLITLLPIWDPRSTHWSYRDRLFNYPQSSESNEDRKYPHVPRRVFINTLARFSKDLLYAMHFENIAGLSMASEMWPATVALQHGFKAVYAPHPIWFANKWPHAYADLVFNPDGWGAGSMPGTDIDDGRGVNFDVDRARHGQPQGGTGPNREGRPGRWGQERDAPYSPDREHYFAGWSWYFWSDFPRVLYWRWLGWKAGFSIVTIEGRKVTDELGLAGGPEWEKEQGGRMCIPSMLLHPVKNVKPPETDEA